LNEGFASKNLRCNNLFFCLFQKELRK